MSRLLRPYSEYRSVGLPWLECCPSHWKTVRPKSIFRRMQRPVRPEDDVVTCFRDGAVTLRKNRRTTGFTEALQEIGYQGIRKGDLVIHAMDAFAGAIGVSDSDGKGTPVYAVCQPSPEADAHYYAFILREMSRSEYLLSLAKGIRERSTDFRYGDFAALEVPMPPRDEQAQIVRFIRHLDQRVNRLIKTKRRLIELLNEQKKAIIHRAVTRGLDPTVPLKPSGMVWIGDVPQHWELIPNRMLMRIRKQAVGNDWSDYKLLSLTMNGVIPRDLENPSGKFPTDFLTYQVVEPNDLVFCLFDIDETPRTVGRVTEVGMLTGAYTRMVVSDPAATEYLFYLYLAFDHQKALKPLYTGLR